ncbi:MAG: uroporphyrinogen decarboxylase family protein [bacterium]
MRGEEVDVIPFAPRLDLWWLSNKLAGSLPEEYAEMKPDDISREKGFACYHMVPDFSNMMRGPEDILHRALGLYNFRQSAYAFRFPDDVDIEIAEKGGLQTIDYHTPKGRIRTVGGWTEEMKKQGASLGWTREHAIKGPQDVPALAYIFANLEVSENFDGAREYIDEIGDCGVVAVGGASLAASPMHHVQKEFLDPTAFFLEYVDHYDALAELAEGVGVYFDKVLDLLCDSPAEVVLWGANYDDMLTYPPYFEKEILPWLKKATERLHNAGKLVATHTDGENKGLMDLIPKSGADVAESLTPHPMTKVSIGEYYEKWADSMTLMGCIPECITLRENTDDEQFEAWLDGLFESIKPGRRVILGIADSTPPNAVMERLDRIAERIYKEGRLTGGD